MRVSVRVPVHQPSYVRTPTRGEPAEPVPFEGRPCYSFNSQLHRGLDDTKCSHCKYYLTARCPNINEFLDDMEDLAPE
ncbi:MAG: hypothetical protein WA761_03495 [Thermoplasmata archaeon]